LNIKTQIQDIRRNWWKYRFNPTLFVVPVPSQDLDFQRHMLWSFVFNSLVWEFVVPVVDIGGIVDHHY